jgi:dGTPase
LDTPDRPKTTETMALEPMAIDAAVPRARFACDPASSRGRLYAEPESKSRSAFRRDCDRVIHSTAFRRLKHKTQVFVSDEGDHFRTRLTHTLEVAQIARALARALGLDEDLAEALALAHDIGHPPFGHAGERALDECLAAFGGFDHNAQTLRVVTTLERRYPTFDGLNLAWETLEGLVKHNGPLTDRSGKPLGRYRERGVPETILEYSRRQDLQLWSFPGLEAQVAAVADDIAYDAHDIDDGIRAGLFGIDDIASVALPGKILGEICAAYPKLEPSRLVPEFIRRLIGLLIEDVVAETGRRLATIAPRTADDVRQAASAIAGFSPPIAEADRAIKGFLRTRMYRHGRVMHVMDQAAGVVRDLFARYGADVGNLPPEWQESLAEADAPARARRIADFIAGMTDRYALAEHARLFDSTPELR